VVPSADSAASFSFWASFSFSCSTCSDTKAGGGPEAVRMRCLGTQQTAMLFEGPNGCISSYAMARRQCTREARNGGAVGKEDLRGGGSRILMAAHPERNNNPPPPPPPPPPPRAATAAAAAAAAVDALIPIRDPSGEGEMIFSPPFFCVLSFVRQTLLFIGLQPSKQSTCLPRTRYKQAAWHSILLLLLLLSLLLVSNPLIHGWKQPTGVRDRYIHRAYPTPFLLLSLLSLFSVFLQTKSYGVIGGSGFLGRWIVDELLKRGESHVRVLDLSPSPALDDRVEFRQGPSIFLFLFSTAASSSNFPMLQLT